ncbi:hypothetical protein PQ455_18635 [Sphingomonas naphthae]|uniref:C-type lysozyme inhibitor domain-containing protein n=1 Tax=Sphingomonas naphthae TaxID=1813468 RepID=A0ABY7TKV6_9SPHN|nr:hypothetical protein [Sphingomonas naphthae]WCT73598.1 hypothetical protein PQ455_18635 [Sphingomonas naphthae]
MMTALAAAALLVAPLTAIPEIYQGHWTTDRAACGGEDTQGVHIEPLAITFYEARGVVRHVSQGSKGASARVDFTGEGKSWNEGVRFRPLPKGDLELTALGRTQTLARCSS